MTRNRIMVNRLHLKSECCHCKYTLAIIMFYFKLVSRIPTFFLTLIILKCISVITFFFIYSPNYLTEINLFLILSEFPKVLNWNCL